MQVKRSVSFSSFQRIGTYIPSPTEHGEVDKVIAPLLGEDDAYYSHGMWCDPSPGDVMCCIINVFEAILFGLFTSIMCCDQMSSIISNTTYIETLQGRRDRNEKDKKSWKENVKTVFGEPLSIRWLLPTPLTPKIMKDFSSLCGQYLEEEYS